MSASIYGGGRRTWGGERDSEGYRTFTITNLVKTTNKDDGPMTVMNCPGLPAIGSVWNFGNDVDLWCFCFPDMSIKIHEEREGEPSVLWRVDQKFSNKPFKRCQDTNIEDPLMEPQKVSGSFIKYTEEAAQDRFGRFLLYSNWEQMRGPQVEFDANRPVVRIEQNVGTLGLATFSQMVDTVNDAPLWGLPARCIKLSNPTWERKIYGTCYYYYTRTFEFDIMYNTFDRFILDQGHTSLHGHWGKSPTGTSTRSTWIVDNIDGAPADKTNPQHFDKHKDRKAENTTTLLDGFGRPLDDGDNPVYFRIEKYHESNFLSLGIPTSF